MVKPKYFILKSELESLGLLTEKDSAHLLAMATSSGLNPYGHMNYTRIKEANSKHSVYSIIRRWKE